MERRRQPRYVRCLGITISDLSDNLLDLKSSTYNLCREGMCVESSVRFNPEDCFRFTLEMPGVGVFSGVARICWSRPPQNHQPGLYGVHIVSGVEDDMNRLRKFLR